MRPPKGLQPRGRSLWTSIVKGLPEGWELDERERAILTLAARQADDLAQLEGLIAKHGPRVTGSAGQPVLNPAIMEARQARIAVDRLLGKLALPDENREPLTEAGRRAQHAARVRWAQAAERKERGRGAA